MAIVTVEVNIDEFDTDDLIEELETRGIHVSEGELALSREDITIMYEEFQYSRDKFDERMKRIFYESIGKII